jgi:hypothetical protein
MKSIIALALAASLAACALPNTEVRTGAVRPALAVQGAPAGAMLYVDGLQIGEAAQYNGVARKMLIEEGVHQVEVRQGGTVLLTQKIFASNGETSTVVVQSEPAK